MVNFVRRHNRWITFIGATSVLAMFIVRDEMGEHARQLADAVDAGRSTAMVMREMGEVPLDFDELRSLAYEAAAARDPKKYPTADPSLTFTSYYAVHYLVTMQKAYDNNTRLLSKLEGRNPDLSKGMDEIKAEFVSAHKQLEQLQVREDTHSPSFQKALSGLKTQLNEMSETLDDQTDSILEAAQGQEERAEARAKLCTEVSYVLFPLGWLLALIGKLYEKDGSAEILEV